MIDKQISHYKILEKIGAGGMGEVFLAEDTRLGRNVALKFLPPEFTRDPEAKQRFEHEAKATAALNHPNIVTIHEIGEHEGQTFIAMEYVEGQTLKDRMADVSVGTGRDLSLQKQTIPIPDAISIAIQIAEGLAAAHEKGIVHRDLKPTNIMVTEQGVAKIVDFGLAKLVGGRTKLTKTGLTVGTVVYMSPEQATGVEVDRRSDLWSLGVVLYEMLTGRHPFAAEYEQAAIYQILNQDPEPLTSLRSDLPGPLVQAVNGCLKKDRGKRIQEAREVLELLDNASRSESAVSRKRRFPKKAAAVAAGLVVMLAAVLFFIFRKTPALPVNAKTIAVLPFLDLSNDPANAYFSDGVTEDILAQLSRLSDLRVISRTTMMQYKGSKKKLSEIGAELKAGVVLEGSVRRSGNRVRIVAKLIDAQKDAHLWADSYDRDLSDILAVQNDVAAKIAAALKATLTPREKEGLKKTAKVDPRAYTLLLQGRYLMRRLDKESNEKAIVLFEQALAIDAADARVWAALAQAHMYKSLMYSCPGIDMKAEWPKVRQEAEKAVALDDNCAEAHSILGQIRNTLDWDWQGAEAEYRRALELDPNNIESIYFMTGPAMDHGRYDEALALARKAIGIDPVNPISHIFYGSILIYLNRFDESLASMHKALDLNPQMANIHMNLGSVYMLQGKPEQALEEMRLEPDPRLRLFGLALAYATMGRIKDADTALAELIRDYKSVSPFQIAEVYAWMGQADKAFEWLEEAFRLRDPGILSIQRDLCLSRIKGDPRYVPFLKKMNLIK